MVDIMSRKQRVLYTFEHKKVDHLAFSPRLYYWYGKNKAYLKPGWLHKRGKPACETEIPKQYFGKTQMQIFDLLGATPRYTWEAMGIPLTSFTLIPNLFKVHPWFHKQKNGAPVFTLKTKLGTLTQVNNPPGGGLGGFPSEYWVKSIEDLQVWKYILTDASFYVFSPFVRYAHWKLGDRGVVSGFALRSPYQRCILEIMGFHRAITFLRRYPREMEDFFAFLDEKDDQVYRKLARSSIPIINFGENIDAGLTPPRLFEKYCMPYYERRVKELHAAGKFCHIHMDGMLKDLLPYLNQLPFDGLEALTPAPAGDVTLEELKPAIGNKILLDGIPSTLFLPQYSMDFVREYTQKVLETFSPNLILGVSDEFPPNGDIRKIELIAQMVEQFNP